MKHAWKTASYVCSPGVSNPDGAKPMWFFLGLSLLGVCS